jgi:hypothetical protein
MLLLSDDNYALRWHTWDIQTSGVPLAEGRHKHAWDFTSLMLAGNYENHSYTHAPAHDDAIEIKAKIDATITRWSPEERQEFFMNLEEILISETDVQSSPLLYQAIKNDGNS